MPLRSGEVHHWARPLESVPHSSLGASAFIHDFVLAVLHISQDAYPHVEGVGEPPDRLQPRGVMTTLDIGDGAVRDLSLVSEVLDAPPSVTPQLGDSDAEGLPLDAIGVLLGAQSFLPVQGFLPLPDHADTPLEAMPPLELLPASEDARGPTVRQTARPRDRAKLSRKLVPPPAIDPGIACVP